MFSNTFLGSITNNHLGSNHSANHPASQSDPCLHHALLRVYTNAAYWRARRNKKVFVFQIINSRQKFLLDSGFLISVRSGSAEDVFLSDTRGRKLFPLCLTLTCKFIGLLRRINLSTSYVLQCGCFTVWPNVINLTPSHTANPQPPVTFTAEWTTLIEER
jgi:hypothetical protein